MQGMGKFHKINYVYCKDYVIVLRNTGVRRQYSGGKSGSGGGSSSKNNLQNIIVETYVLIFSR